jgi:putative ATP-binding cassette transporter
LPLGTLRRAVTYPDAAQSRSVEEIAKVLDKVELGHLADRLDEDGPWDQILSGGEKQRLAFARLLLHRPDIIVLDEATAALDSPSQNRVMQLLSQELKGTTVISIGHRAELAAFHHRKIILWCGRGGARLVSDVPPARSASAQDSSAGKTSSWRTWPLLRSPSSIDHRPYQVFAVRDARRQDLKDMEHDQHQRDIREHLLSLAGAWRRADHDQERFF